MARTLSSAYLAAISNSATRPGYLVEIKVSTAPATYERYSTRGTLIHDTYTWTGGASVSPADQAWTVELSNIDDSASSWMLDDAQRDRAVKIYVCEQHDAGLYVEQVMSGYVDAIESITLQRARFTVARNTQRMAIVPVVRYAPPLVNYAVSPGATITVGSTTITLA